MEQVRVLIVDDHPVINEGLTFLLNEFADIKVVGTAKDGEEGLAQVRRLQPDCVILDLNMPKLGGMEAIRLYLQEKPDLKIAVFTGHTQESLLNQALQAGARAYVFKGTPISALVSAIREVHRGGYWLSTELTPSVIKRYLCQHHAEGNSLAAYHSLSKRENEVFHLLAKGKSPQEIGKTLFISIKTVSKHQSAIKHKLKVKNAAEIVLYSLRIGLGPGSDL